MRLQGKRVKIFGAFSKNFTPLRRQAEGDYNGRSKKQLLSNLPFDKKASNYDVLSDFILKVRGFVYYKIFKNISSFDKYKKTGSISRFFLFRTLSMLIK